MFVMTKQAVLFRRPDGETFYAPNNYVGAVPDWVTETKQFQRQAATGKIVVSQTSKDKDLEAAESKAAKKGKGKGGKKPEPAPENPESGEGEPEPAPETEDEPEA